MVGFLNYGPLISSIGGLYDVSADAGRPGLLTIRATGDVHKISHRRADLKGVELR